jgi:3-deoxy-D-manno-octulosonic-acid transferase
LAGDFTGFRGDDRILLLDTIGELTVFYAAADVAFVGGSLLPGMTGHNVLEPASLGLPVISGRHTGAFADIVRQLTIQQALCLVADAAQLAEAVTLLLADASLRRRMGDAGRDWVMQNRGSTGRVMHLLRKVLANGPVLTE